MYVMGVGLIWTRLIGELNEVCVWGGIFQSGRCFLIGKN